MDSEIIFNTGETNVTLKEQYNLEGSLLRKCQLRMLDMLIYMMKSVKNSELNMLLMVAIYWGL